MRMWTTTSLNLAVLPVVMPLVGNMGTVSKGYGEMRATQSDAVSSGAFGQAPKNRKF